MDDDYKIEYGPNGLRPCAHVTIESLIDEAKKDGISLAELDRQIKGALDDLWRRNPDNFDLGVEQDNLLHAINLLETHRVKCGGALPETPAGES